MKRFRFVVFTAFLAGILSGCGEDQPNQPAKPSDLGADFGNSAQDQMKAANAGMDLKAQKARRNEAAR